MDTVKISAIWETYRACWNERIAEVRQHKLQQITAEGFEYRDPNVEIEGLQSLCDYMGQFQTEFGGASFVITNLIVHHNRSLAHWNMVSAQNEVLSTGSSFAQYQEGKLMQVTGFFKEN